MNERITVCIVHFNDAEFVLTSLYCLKKLTKNSYKVLILDNGSKIKNYNKLKQGIKVYPNVFLRRKETDLRGSMAHGTALNELVSKVDTPFFAILDADCTFLKKDWDEILIGEMNERVKAVGTRAPLPKPQDFPLMFAILLETETFKSLNIDFRPNDLSKNQDTGCEMRDKYIKAGFSGLNIEKKNTREYQDGPFATILGVDEYYFKGDNDIFASHFGRGATFGAAKYAKGTNFIYRLPVIGKFFRIRRGKKEKKQWTKICQKIL